MSVKCVVNFSGGAGSFVAAQRAIERKGGVMTDYPEDHLPLTKSQKHQLDANEKINEQSAELERLRAEHQQLLDDLNKTNISQFTAIVQLLREATEKEYCEEHGCVHVSREWHEKGKQLLK